MVGKKIIKKIVAIRELTDNGRVVYCVYVQWLSRGVAILLYIYIYIRAATVIGVKWDEERKKSAGQGWREPESQ